MDREYITKRVYNKPLLRRLARKRGFNTITDKFYKEFISFIYLSVSDLSKKSAEVAQQHNRKTIISADVKTATAEIFNEDMLSDNDIIGNKASFHILIRDTLNYNELNSIMLQSSAADLMMMVMQNYILAVFACAMVNTESEDRVRLLDRDLRYAIQHLKMHGSENGKQSQESVSAKSPQKVSPSAGRKSRRSKPKSKSPQTKSPAAGRKSYRSKSMELDINHTREELNKYKVVELKEMYKNMNIGKYNGKTMSSMKKAELIDAIYNNQK